MRRMVRRPAVTTRKRSAVPLSRPFKRARRSYGRRVRTVVPRGGDHSSLRVSAGRPRRVGSRTTTALAVDYRIFRYQRVNRQDGVEPTVTAGASTTAPLGSQILYNTVTIGDPLTVYQQVPIHIYDLTSTINFDDTANVCYQLTFDGSTTAPKWYSFGANTKPDGTVETQNTVGAWKVEYSTNTTINLKKPYISPRWYDIRLLCYGARRQPTTYEILIVRFTKDWLVPDFDGFGQNSLEATDEKYGFWQGMAKRLIFSDILPSQSRIGAVNRGMRVLKRVKFMLPSADSTDADTAPPSKAVRLFVPDGRVLRYRPNTDSFIGSGNMPKLGGSGYIQSLPANGNEVNYPIEERQRTFMIVRATNTTPVALGSVSVDDTPSYDVCIRKKEAIDAH